MKPDLKLIKSIDPDGVYTFAEAAELCSMSAAGIASWAKRGTIKKIAIGNRFFVTGAELKKAIQI
jgi:hypothetical protein